MRRAAVLALGVIIVVFSFLLVEPAGAHPFDPSAARFHAAVANPIAGSPSDLGLLLRLQPPNAMPAPFGGVNYRLPPGWHISPDEVVPNGDIVGGLVIALDAMPVTDPSCPPITAPMPSIVLPVPLRDASSNSDAPGYPPFLPPGDHWARWAGVLPLPDMPVRVNIIVDEEPSVLAIFPPPPPAYMLRVFVGPGPDSAASLPESLNVIHPCLALSIVLGVKGHSSSGVPVAVNPPTEGDYTLASVLVSTPDPVDGHRHRMVLEAGVSIKEPRPPAVYHVKVSDPRPAVNSHLGMALGFGPGRLRPQPFGGIVHRVPAGWDIAAGDAVPPGDNTAFLRVVLDVPPSLENVCPLAFLPPVALVVPLYNAPLDARPDYLSDSAAHPYKARWVGRIHRDGPRPIPVNVLVRGDAADGHALRIFIGTGPQQYKLLRVPPCFSIEVGLGVRGESASGVPVATNPPLEGTYTFVAEVTTIPDSNHGVPITFSLSADVVIKAGPKPPPCSDCPAGDLDADGLADAVDQCPADAEDANGVEDGDGCPDSGDADGDGLLNGVEALLGIDAFASDSEGDGLDDLAEVDTYGSDPLDPDTDDDGCPDGAEAQAIATLGGARDPLNPYDFYDVPAPSIAGGGDMSNRNSAINVTGDVLAVLEYAGTSSSGTTCNSGPDAIPGNADDRCYTDDKDGDGHYDGLAYDRSPGSAAVPPHAWSDAPNGAISITQDVLLVLAQSGHTCAAAP